MQVYTFKRVQTIPASIEQTWNFFSRAQNLQKITPLHLKFKILTRLEDRNVTKGQVIQYTVRPFFNIPLRWTTIITEVRDKILFIDEQSKGPFAYWRHEHHFKEINGATEMTDIVQYKMPLGIIGALVRGLLVKRALKKIFDYRETIITQIYSTETD